MFGDLGQIFCLVYFETRSHVVQAVLQLSLCTSSWKWSLENFWSCYLLGLEEEKNQDPPPQNVV